MTPSAARLQKRVLDRAFRRTQLTHMPISRAVEIETLRFIGSLKRRDTSSISYLPEPPETHIFSGGSALPEFDMHQGGGSLTRLAVGEALRNVASNETLPETEVTMPVSEAPSPIPEEAATVTASEDHSAEVEAKKANIGRKVKWIAIGKTYTGTIAHVIPPGVSPREDLSLEVGAKRTKKEVEAGVPPKTRDHISYVVSVDGGDTLAWPMKSALEILDAE